MTDSPNLLPEPALDLDPDTAAPPDLSAPVPTSPEDNVTFRAARLLLLLAVARATSRKISTIDRLGYLEFFADNPFMVVDTGNDDHEGDIQQLELAGFSPVQLSYASSGQRFASRRERLKHDLALLLSRGLTTVDETGYVTTEHGERIAEQLDTVYADAYRTSATIVLRRLGRLSNAALQEAARARLGESWLLIDLLDDINATDTTTGDHT